MKKLIIPLLLILALALVVFSQPAEGKAKAYVFFNAAVLEEKLPAEEKIEVSLPYSVGASSLTVRADKDVESIEIMKVGELEGNIGKEVKVFFKDREIGGTLMDIRDGKAYIESNGYLYVVSPEGYAVKEANSLTKVNIAFNGKPTFAELYYETPEMNWKGETRIFLGEKAKVVSYAAIQNQGERAFEGIIKLYPSFLSSGARGVAKGYMLEGAAGGSIASYSYETPLSKVFVVEAKLPPKSSVMKELGEGEGDYKIVDKYIASFYATKGKPTTTLTLKAPTDIVAGEVYVFYNGIEGKALVGNRAKGEEVEIPLKQDYNVEVSVEVANAQWWGKEKEETFNITISNYGEEKKEVEVSLLVPYERWRVEESSERYEEKKGKLIYKVSVEGKGVKTIRGKIKAWMK